MRSPNVLEICFLLVMLATTNAESTRDLDFAIYLAIPPVEQSIISQGTNWSEVKLAEHPLFTGKDVIAYDFTTHTLTLTDEARKRVPQPSILGTPFVVMAHGERIYLGAFVTSLSSYSTAVPSIIVDNETGALRITRAYPQSTFAKGRDLRNDHRIHAVFSSP